MSTTKKMAKQRGTNKCFRSCFDKYVKVTRNKRIYVIALDLLSTYESIHPGACTLKMFKRGALKDMQIPQHTNPPNCQEFQLILKKNLLLKNVF